jgi:HAMP domain-containing protein
MTLIVLTVVVIALLVAVLAICLFAIGVLLNRTADNLEDCAQSVKTIGCQAEVIGPALERINQSGATVVGALPLLVEGAESIAATLAPPADLPGATTTPVTTPAAPSMPMTVSGAPRGVGYLDREGVSFGYLDA